MAWVIRIMGCVLVLLAFPLLLIPWLRGLEYFFVVAQLGLGIMMVVCGARLATPLLAGTELRERVPPGALKPLDPKARRREIAIRICWLQSMSALVLYAMVLREAEGFLIPLIIWGVLCLPGILLLLPFGFLTVRFNAEPMTETVPEVTTLPIELTMAILILIPTVLSVAVTLGWRWLLDRRESGGR